MKITTYVLPALALGAAAILFAPTENVLGYSTIGGSLSAEAQRDVRVYNNFSDAASNDNTTIHSNWPGWDGAELALWKATAEWGAELFGDGTGDGLQTVGSGGANFDAYWAGHADGIGSSDHNIISAVSSCSSGVIAYVEAPISNGWRMRFCDGNFNFSDGPDSVSYFQMDIQGIATHEYGHSLGLGHSATSSATMYAYVSGNGTAQRSIASDDQAGVRYIYGTKSASKPRITGVSVGGTTVTITGTNFSATGNEVWFTNNTAIPTTTNPHLKVTGVSSTGGGTQIVVTAPGGSGPGNVVIKQNATGHSSLSNAYPIDVNGGPPPDPVAQFSSNTTTGITPLVVAFSDESTGTGLYSWSWDFGDTGTSTLRNPTHTYYTQGSFTVSLTVHGTYGSYTETKVDYIVVTGSGYAGATTRNGSGVNPDIFTSTSLPILGTDWTSENDAGSIGVNGFVFVFVYAGSLPGTPTPFGELLLDPAAAWLYTDMAIAFGGIASHSIGIPSDPIYAGNQAFAQGYLNSVAPSGQLTNAIDLVLGY
jgi:PKD repeat protein